MSVSAWIQVDARKRAASAARATMAALACPECQAIAGRPCRGPRFHDARARVAGVDPGNPSSATRVPAIRTPSATAATGPALAPDPDAPRRQFEVHTYDDRTADIEITIAAAAAFVIENEIRLIGNHVETGGPLVARKLSPRRLEIAHAGGPGAKAKRKRDSYTIDHAGDLLWEQGVCSSDPTLCSVGFWHSQPSSVNPSAADLQVFASAQQCIGMSHHLGLIVTVDRGKLAAKAWITTRVRNSCGAEMSYWRCMPASKLTVQTDSRSWRT